MVTSLKEWLSCSLLRWILVHNEILNFVSDFGDIKSRKEKKSWGGVQTLWKDLGFS